MEYVHLQFSSFLLLLLTGMALGGFLDLYRVFRGVIRAKRFLTPIGDMLFWMVAVIIFTPLIYWSTWLELRLYVWLSLLLGVTVYYLVFSRIMIPIYLKFWHALTWFPRQLVNGFSFAGLRFKRLWQSIRLKRPGKYFKGSEGRK